MRHCITFLFLLLGALQFASGQTYSEPLRLPVNSPEADFGAVWYRDGILFSSERNNSDAGVTHIERASGSFLADLYFAKRKDSLRWGRPGHFAAALTSRMHEGPVAVDRDSLSLLLVRSLPLPKREAEKAPVSEILHFRREGNKWSGPEVLVLGPNTATYTDPQLSPDGNWLYFASDMPGGRGGLDLYRISWPLDGRLAENLGPAINTQAHERYPFLSGAGYLYFSTAGRSGLGGLDIFRSRLSPGAWMPAEALPLGLNTEFDDFGFHLSQDGSEGLLCSNRAGGGRNDDLYYFTVTRTEVLECSHQQRNNYCYELYEEGSGELPIPSLFYRWDLGDGTHAKGVRVDHCFPRPGDYDISLSVYDSLTNLPVFQQTQYRLEIRDVEQAYIQGPDSLPAGEEAEWDALKSNLPDFEIQRYAWDMGDGTEKSGGRISHRYQNPGAYEMQLVVYGISEKDPDQHYQCVTRTVQVGPEGSPIADSFAPQVFPTDSSDSAPDKGGPSPALLQKLPRGLPGSLSRIQRFSDIPQAHFQIQAGTSPRIVNNAEMYDHRLLGLEKVEDGDIYRHILPERFDFTGAMQAIRRVRAMGFENPAILVFRGDTLVPHQPFIDYWIPGDSIPETVVRGVVTDRQKRPKGGNVVWENLITGEVVVETPINAEDGSFEQKLPRDVFYGYFVDLEGYYSISQNLDLRNYTGDWVIQDSLEVISIEDLIRDHLPVRINNLFFDFDKYEIRQESYRELYRIVRFLLEHPQMKIEIAGHTDDRGTPDYNQVLSRKRASAVAQFLVLSGCDPENILPKGFGETKPVTHNLNPTARQLNRRVEFSILSE